MVRDLHQLAVMSTKETASRVRANGATRIHWSEIGRRVKSRIAELPANLGDRTKHDPYVALGIAAAAGVGVGIVLGSRILRTALTSAVTYAVVELARTYVLERMPVNGTRMPHVADVTHATRS